MANSPQLEVKQDLTTSNSDYLFGDHTESFNDTSYYGYPAKGTLHLMIHV